MTLKPLQVIGYCPFARLASSDCFFIGSSGCKLMPNDMDHSLMMEDHHRAIILARRAAQLDETSGTKIQGPFNRLLTVPVASVEHPASRYEMLSHSIVMSSQIDVSTPSYHKELAAILGVCIAVVGTRTEEGAGTFNILLHLLPNGHQKHTMESKCIGSGCCSQQFTRWMRIRDDQQRKSRYLANMLNIFRGGEWDITVVTPLIGKIDSARWTDHLDVGRHLTNTLGFDKDSITLEPGENVTVSPDGSIDVKQSIR